jgi:outer membrane receptor protein involved in Fe transport
MFDAVPPPPAGEIIVVTGRALPDAAAQRAYQVQSIDRRELANSPSHELDGILKQVPGLQLFRRSDSTSGHPTSQGVTLRALGGNASSRALLILDGVPQADPFGGWVNWPAYDAAGLQEVRVLRGGGGVPYGPGALAGVIDMTSLSSPGVDATVEAGSRQSLRGHMYAGAPLGSSMLTLDAQGARSDGFVPVTRSTRGPADRPAPYKEASLRARWIAPLSNDVEAQLSGLAFVDDRERGVSFTGNRTRGADTSLRIVGRGRWQWSALAYAQWRNLRSSFASVSDGRLSASQVSLQDSVPSRSLGFSGEVRPPIGHGIDLRLGADGRFTSGESRELYSFVSGEPTRRRIAGGDTATQGLFADATYKSGPVTLSGGARLDHWTISDGRLMERLLAGGAPTRDDAYAKRSGWQPTVRAAGVFDLAKGSSFRAVAYRGWRMPTLNELFRPFRAGADATAANAGLKPETVTGAEAGLDYRRDRLDFSVTAFVNRLHDAIANVTLGRGPGTFPGVGFVAGDYRQRQNIDAVNVRGLEASGKVRRGPWSLRLGASLTNAKVDARGAAASLDGLRPAQTPRVALSGALGWDDEGRALALQLTHVGSQFEDDQNLRKLRPATTVDAFAAWPLSRRVQMIARGQNLLDKTIEAAINDDGSIERATPRTLWIGLRFSSLP